MSTTLEAELLAAADAACHDRSDCLALAARLRQRAAWVRDTRAALDAEWNTLTEEAARDRWASASRLVDSSPAPSPLRQTAPDRKARR